MIPLLLTVLTVFAILLISEWGWRKGWLANEFGRKFVHITVGCFVAFWPYFLTWGQIRFLSVAFLVVVVLTSYFNTFHAISSVQRPTYGEFFFAATVGILATLNTTEAIYAVAVLHMSLADGLAALVGVRYGRDNKYHILGHTKSVAGTGAFFITSLVILMGYSLLTGAMLPVALILFIAAAASMLENIAVLGLDNLAVPLVVCLLLVRF